MHKFDQSVIERAILHYGIQEESIICMEECSELQKEVSKFLRREGNQTALVLEMADVLICIEMLKKMYGVPDDLLDAAITLKQDRTMKRIDAERIKMGEQMRG